MELSEEENKAIEILKKLQKKPPYIIWGDGTPYNKSNQIQTILNLIDNQQKEIEELKDKNKTLEGLLQGNLYELYLYYKELASKYQANCISKDTIREKIKAFQDVKKEIIKNENKLSRASITYDIVRNDYCEKMLNQLLEVK